MDTATHPTQELLAQLSDGLLMPSETDAPFKSFFWPSDAELSEAEIAAAAGIEDAGEAEELTLSEFLDDAAAEEDWMEDEELEQAKRFQALREGLLTHLSDVTVLVFGERKRTAVIVGKVKESPSGFAGLITQVVET